MVIDACCCCCWLGTSITCLLYVHLKEVPSSLPLLPTCLFFPVDLQVYVTLDISHRRNLNFLAFFHRFSASPSSRSSLFVAWCSPLQSGISWAIVDSLVLLLSPIFTSKASLSSPL
ncbi:unnamed protein product [Heterobilharzia americana]|nr:unnamed protein product [Heterobilharzia americana]